MNEREVLEVPALLLFLQDQYKTPELCERVVEEDSLSVMDVPDHLKTP